MQVFVVEVTNGNLEYSTELALKGRILAHIAEMLNESELWDWVFRSAGRF